MRLFDRARERRGSISRPFLLSWLAISGICASDGLRVVGALGGKYASSEERLQDPAGIKPPKIGGLKNFPFREV
jgi:hypothetical protein